ncbi:hypothetical protein Tco_0155162 [Tanacetum coccineum]
MMRETEVHKFSDGMLTRILEKLDHMVKDFRLFKYNPGIENRIWFEDDKRRSKEFMEVIERRLKIRRIFRNLESFVSGRVILPKKQVAKTRHPEEIVTIADATQIQEASKLAEEQVNQPKTAEAKKVLDQNIQEENKAAQEKPESPYETESEIKIIKKFQPRHPNDDAQITFFSTETSYFEYDQPKSKHGDSDSDSGLRSMPDDDLVSLTGFETPDLADNNS